MNHELALVYCYISFVSGYIAARLKDKISFWLYKRDVLRRSNKNWEQLFKNDHD